MGRVEGKVAFITGAARGQGRSHAVRLAQEGADIIAVDICGPVPHLPYPPATPQDLEQTVADVEAAGGRIVARQADVRDREGLKGAVAAGVAEFGKLDTVVANAGIVLIAEWDDVTPEMFREVIDINLVGAWNTVQIAAPHLVEAGGGSIIITSSAAGLKGLPFLTPYAASKHGVVGLMRTLAAELAQHGIRVNTLHPTGVNTPMGAAEDGSSPMEPMLEKHPQLAGMLANMLPIQITESIDQSNAVLFLASDESRYVTSLTMTVDAGNTQY